MLTPDYLAECTADIVSLYQKLNEQITQDICRRAILTGEITPSAAWQAKMLQESGKLFDDIVADVAKATNRTEPEIAKLFNDAGVRAVKYDAEPLIRAGMKAETGLSPAMTQILEANAQKLQGDFRNLTMTTASAGQNEFIEAMNEATMMVESGAFDYQTAIRRVVDRAAEIGGVVMYPSGTKMSLEAAARMNIMTAVNQTCSKITEMNAERLGAEYYETSAHMGARDTHVPWQGQVFKIDGADPDYGNFYDETGYGEPDGLCGVNCRHSFYPYFPGISERAYSEEQLDEYADHTVEYEGIEYSDYEASQIQRRYERAIRESKRKIAGFDAAIDESTDEITRAALEAARESAKQTLKNRSKRLTDFCKQTGREKEYLRVKVGSMTANEKKATALRVSDEGKTYSAMMKAAEKNIKNNKAETAVLLDNQGNILFSESQGIKNQVTFTNEQVAMMKGANLTHNHPSSGTFSNEDVELLVKKELRTIRATSELRTYQLRRLEGEYDKRESFVSDLASARDEAKKKTDEKYGKISYLQYNNYDKYAEECEKLNKELNNAIRKWFKENSKGYGYRYSEYTAK